MKKVVVLILLIMTSWTLHAQWSLTPEIGLTAVNRTNSYLYNNWRAGWKLGVGVERELSDLFSLKSGVYYTQRGYSYSLYGSYSHYVGPNDLVHSNYYQDGKINRHFLQIPLMAKFSWQLSEDIRMNVAAGPYVAFSMSDNWEWSRFYPGEHYDYSGGYYPGGYYGYPNYGYGYGYGAGYMYGGSGYGGYYSYGDNSNELNNFDWGLSASVGIEVKNWVANIGYDVSLGKEYPGFAVEANYHTFSLSVGYKFNFGK